MRGRGTTLVELLVVMSVWTLIMVAVLGFYIYATRVHRRYDQMSQELRSIQQVADKFNTVLRHANLLAVYQFPPTIIFSREEESFPSLPGCLLPNVRAQLEFIGIAPDTKRAGLTADPRTCKDNAIYLGFWGQRGQILQQLPHGIIAEAQLVQGLLMLSFNNPSRSQQLPLPNAGEIKDMSQLNSQQWQPVNHFFQFRGLTSSTRFIRS
ncbi:hypothetical protein JST97_08070 [bacterium]|nr:hypothetical protein [bacterium]